MKAQPVVLVIRDGWGINHRAAEKKWDATRQIPTPNADILEKFWPHTEITASGLDVGLPEGIMGNSEVGHQNIGAGRIVDQEIVRIDRAFATGEIDQNSALNGALEWVRLHHSKLHLFGLLSSGGVHSMISHAEGLLKVAAKSGLKRIYLHAFMDGRDTPPQSGIDYIRRWEKFAKTLGTGQIASVIGRFWAMDRDKRWQRVEKAYQCLSGGPAIQARSAEEAVLHYYQHPLNGSQNGDEFITPTQILNAAGEFEGVIGDGDGVIFFNFRGDRPREITRAFADPKFDAFPRPKSLGLYYATMTEYEKNLAEHILFPKPPPMKNILGDYLSQLGLKQFRTAETEKYAHVTFFFNDYRENPFPGEDRRLIPSPKEVATYDQKPEMSAEAVCDGVIDAMNSEQYDFIVVNYANPDMVGHTGKFEATKAAIDTIDRCIGRMMSAADQHGQQLLITADHGNAEEMWDAKHQAPHTQHTTNPVEVLLYGNRCRGLKLRAGGRLADIAPTILEMMELSQPSEMTGRSLLKS